LGLNSERVVVYGNDFDEVDKKMIDSSQVLGAGYLVRNNGTFEEDSVIGKNIHWTVPCYLGHQAAPYFRGRQTPRSYKINVGLSTPTQTRAERNVQMEVDTGAYLTTVTTQTINTLGPPVPVATHRAPANGQLVDLFLDHHFNLNNRQIVQGDFLRYTSNLFGRNLM
jgi:hypothetical protein